MRIRYCDRLRSSGDALPVILRAHAELVSNGLSEMATLPPDASVLYCIEDDVVAGVILMEEQSEEGPDALWVYLVWVEPHFRRKGIFNKMWEELHRHAAQRGIPTISLSTQVGNIPMHAAMLSVMGKVTYQIYDYKVQG